MDKWNMNGCKLLWHMDRVSRWKKGERVAPLLIDIGATKKCQLHCSYCYGDFQRKSSEVIPRDVLINLCHDAPHLGVKAMSFTGDGENTLNPALYDAVIMGKENGLDLSLATNGVAINDAQNEILARNMVWLRYNISAATPESYKIVHGMEKKIFDKVMYNIQKSVEIKKKFNLSVTIGLQMVLIPDCINDVIPLSKLAVDFGVDYLVIKQFSDPGSDVKVKYDLSKVNSEEWSKILKTAENMSTDKTQIVVKWSHLERKGTRPYDHCVDCALLFQISGNSKCYPCGYLFNKEEYCYGDLKKQTLEEILNSQQYWKIVEHMTTRFNVHKDCAGGCRHDETNIFLWNLMHPPKHINFI